MAPDFDEERVRGWMAQERHVVAALYRGFVLRALFASALGIGVVYAALEVGADSDAVRSGLVRDALGALTGIGFVAAWLWSGERTRQVYFTVERMARLRGYSRAEAGWSRAFGGALLLARLVLPSTLVVALTRLVLAGTLPVAGRALVGALGALAYAGIACMVLCGVALAARALLPERGKLAFFALVLVPWLASFGAPVPNVPDLLDALRGLSAEDGAEK